MILEKLSFRFLPFSGFEAVKPEGKSFLLTEGGFVQRWALLNESTAINQSSGSDSKCAKAFSNRRASE